MGNFNNKGHQSDELTNFMLDNFKTGEFSSVDEEKEFKERTIGDYQIKGVLGRGGMGTVYAAVHKMIGKRAAIKILNEDVLHTEQAARQFIDEARTVNQISHPYIVDIYSCGQLDNGQIYLVMEWLQGETLGAHLKTNQLPFETAIEYATQLSQALVATHLVGVVHRDLKPENIYLVERDDADTTIRILDFGISSKSQSDQYRQITSTNNPLPIGTPAYVSPEQARGQDVTKASDVYSLGCIFYELFTGHKTFKAETALEIVSKHLYETPEPPHRINPGLSKPISKLIQSMLNKESTERPKADEVAETLSRFKDTMSTFVLDKKSPTSKYRLIRQSLTLACCGVACLAGAVYAFNGNSVQPNASIKPTKKEIHVEPLQELQDLARIQEVPSPSLFELSDKSTQNIQSESEVQSLQPIEPTALDSRKKRSDPAKAQNTIKLSVRPTNAVINIDGVLVNAKEGNIAVPLSTSENHIVGVSKNGYKPQFLTINGSTYTEGRPLKITLERIKARSKDSPSKHGVREATQHTKDLKEF